MSTLAVRPSVLDPQVDRDHARPAPARRPSNPIRRAAFRVLLSQVLLTAIAVGPVRGQCGSLSSWGQDDFGQVGSVPSGNSYVAIADGGSYCLALTVEGFIDAWGSDEHGQVLGAPTGAGHVAIAAGYITGLALTSDGSIVAWGNDDEGQVSGAPPGSGYKAVAVGGFTCYALTADGAVVAWGTDGYGQVSSAPTGTGFTELAAGPVHACALAADGSIEAWGNDIFDQVSTAPAGSGYLAIASGNFHCYALSADGSIEAWGEDSGVGVISQTPSGTGFTTIAAGGTSGYALDPTGSIVAWGWDFDGQVTGTPTGADYVAIAAGSNHALALRSSAGGSFVDLGPSGLPGTFGEPFLTGDGDLSPGSTTGFTVSCTGAQPGAQGFAFLNFGGSFPASFFGGTLYPFPIDRQLTFMFDGAGALVATAGIDAAIPCGTAITMQFLFADPAAAFGVAGSNGLRLDVH